MQANRVRAVLVVFVVLVVFKTTCKAKLYLNDSFSNNSNNIKKFCIFAPSLTVLFVVMNKVRITAIRQTIYEDLMAKYENPIEHTCNVSTGQQWISVDGQQPEGPQLPAAASASRDQFPASDAGKLDFTPE